ncbi:MAG: 16S rRNA (cytidine(1402)-2'-O)-methyltransferase [Proteobacteria bacterium]|nr:16S rRNA (cytidine(1402)-2'-O)-methyltransferase [Pseudomonadota bacterium]MDA0914072.1 16S rRNA (cytidine(1402)-2'-O)-methyltransferase [Pseudomonadota bacterium]MDA1033044.1 16S rRNA (cytidine(1402)-2'-O)-methyltransferase [Pseudomonadota bacterium]
MNTIAPKQALSEPLHPGLYIVATPIGNLGDITLRAIDILSKCDAVACEDTRVTGKLLKHLGTHKPLIRYDDHASEAAGSTIIERARSEAIALVSDAGTPLISDPGYRLVKAARDGGVAVTTLPGACAAIAGLIISGLPNDRFLFAGFLPTKEKARADALTELSSIHATLIFYESGQRLVKSLNTMGELWPTREVAVARELTKLYEERRGGTATELAEHYTANPPKGEIVLMVAPPVENACDADPDALLREALVTMKTSQAAARVAKATGLDRKALYARAMELKAE